MIARRRRGEPLIALALLLGAWVSARAMLWEPQHTGLADPAPGWTAEVPAPPAGAVAVHRPATGASPPAPTGALRWAPPPSPLPQVAGWQIPAALPLALVAAGPAPQPAPEPAAPLRVAAGHQLLWMAAIAQLPMPALPFAARADAAPLPVPPAANPPGSPLRRWSVDGWLVLRPGARGPNLGLASPSYGASQAGAVLRYRLDPDSGHRPAAYLRATAALARPRNPELAAGLMARPLARLPVAAMAEVRVREVAGKAAVRPAALIVTELPPAALPLGLRAEAYGQAGYVGGKDATPFADGQLRIDRQVLMLGNAELRAGAGIWGGAQRGAQRLDIGPGATLGLKLGSTGARLSADWRFRVAGDAEPGSGPALTLSAGF